MVHARIGERVWRRRRVAAVKPYWSGDGITLYLGDCREVTEWLTADVLVTDPPYGLSSRIGGRVSNPRPGRAADVGDESTAVRDEALVLWGSRPAVCFGDLRLEPPERTTQVLIYKKPSQAGIIGSKTPFRRDVEAIYLSGRGWPARGTRSAVIATSTPTAWQLSKPAGHTHAKPLDVLQVLIGACPPGVIADPFAGSGSTLVAARLQGREAIGVEVEEKYCEIAARRLDQGVLDFGDTA